MLTNKKYKTLNWNKNQGLIPTIIQHAISGEILMLGYMSKESMIVTKNTGYVTFFSRSKNRLWTKGEKSGNTLKLIDWCSDCDNDTLLFFVIPYGATCHNNTNSCFRSTILPDFHFLYQLEQTISEKKYTLLSSSTTSSYTTHLYASGIKRIAQKVGEEGLETALAAISCNTKELINEASDLIYHLLVLLQYKSLQFNHIIQELKIRNINKQQNTYKPS